MFIFRRIIAVLVQGASVKTLPLYVYVCGDKDTGLYMIPVPGISVFSLLLFLTKVQ